MTVGTELAPGPNAVDITPTKDAGIMKEIKVIYKNIVQHAACPLLGAYNGCQNRGILSAGVYD